MIDLFSISLTLNMSRKMSIKAATIFLGFFIASAVSQPIAQLNDEETVSVECLMGGDTHCTLDNVKLSGLTKIEIIAPKPEEILSVVFLNSEIESLSSVICETFPNLVYLDAENTGLHEVQKDAFESCTKLESLNLGNNKLEHVANEQFNKLTHLKYLYLNGNHLRMVNDKQFEGLSELLFLYLHNNQIRHFPASALKSLDKLIVLSFHTNDLADIDAEGFVSTVPKLRVIEFNNNPISCVRLETMFQLFNAASYDLMQDEDPRDRFYHTIEINGFKCLEDVEWTGAYYRSLNLQPQEVAKTEQEHEMKELTDEVKELEHEIVELEVLLAANHQ